MKLWERLEYIIEYQGWKTFTSQDLVSLGIDREVASAMIQDYQRVQVMFDSYGERRTSSVITRHGRTRRAEWHVGTSSKSAKEMGEQFASDVACRVENLLAPVLSEIMARNPRAASDVARIMMGVGRSLAALESLNG